MEIVGLPEAEPEGTPSEEELPDLPNPLTSDDIDICHVLPTNRKDQKIVAVCKFVRRKSKFDILNARKNCHDFKYKENVIYINDHLNPYFRNLFALASQKKKSLGLKYLWTKNNKILMRENEHIISIGNEKCIDELSRSESE